MENLSSRVLNCAKVVQECKIALNRYRRIRNTENFINVKT